MIERLRRMGRAISEWCSFQMGTVSIILRPSRETPLDRAIREEGERLRRAFLWLDERCSRYQMQRTEENYMTDIAAIAGRMRQDITKAIASAEILRSATSDTSLMECFNIGYAAPAFDFLRHSILLDQIMALMRLWDRRKDANSVISLDRLLSDHTVLEKLVKRERGAAHDITQADVIWGEAQKEIAFSPERSSPDLRERQLQEKVASLRAAVKTTRKFPEITRLEKYRHEILAHSAALIRRLRVPNYGDVQRVLELSIPVVSEGFRLATGVHHDFSTTQSVWDLSQKDLWEIVRSAARGERYTPLAPNLDDLGREVEGKGSITIKG